MPFWACFTWVSVLRILLFSGARNRGASLLTVDEAPERRTKLHQGFGMEQLWERFWTVLWWTLPEWQWTMKQALHGGDSRYGFALYTEHCIKDSYIGSFTSKSHVAKHESICWRSWRQKTPGKSLRVPADDTGRPHRVWMRTEWPIKNPCAQRPFETSCPH